MLKNWLKIAFRQYRKNALYTFINVLGLTLGLVALTLMTLYWNDEKSYEQWNPSKDDIYMVESKAFKSNEFWPSAPLPLGINAKEKFPEITEYLYAEGWGFEAELNTGDKLIKIPDCHGTQENFFDFFPFETVYGDPKKALIDFNRVALSEKTSKILFGDENPVGKTVTHNHTDFVIEGVYRIPGNTMIPVNYLLKSGFLDDEQQDEQRWGNYNHKLFLKLTPTADIVSLQKKLGDFIVESTYNAYAEQMGLTREEALEQYGDIKINLTKLSDSRLNSKSQFIWETNGNMQLILIGFGLAIIILVLSCINCINLVIANASKRAKEVGVRKALGANQFSVFLQMFLEILLLGAFSFFIAMVIIELLLPTVNHYFDKEIAFNDPKFIGLSAIILAITTIISGLTPAIYLSNFKPIKVLKGNFSRSKSGIWLRNGILVLQFMISAFFIITAIVVQSQVSYMMNKEVGFRGDQVVEIRFKKWEENLRRGPEYNKAKLLLGKVPGVLDISTSSFSPNGMRGNNSTTDYKNQSELAYANATDYNFLDMLNIPLKEGRNLKPELASDTINKCLVNETLVKKFGWKEALGKKIQPGWDSIEYEIVGVVKDYHQDNIASQIHPMMFINHRTTWYEDQINNVLLKIDKNDISGTIAKIENIWTSEIEPGYIFEYNFIDQQFQETFEEYQRQRNLFFTLMTIVIVIAVLGLFAMASYVMQQRLKEVAIRKTLGAEDSSIIKILTRNYFLIVSIATLLALPFCYLAMKEWLSQFAFRIGMPYWAFPLGFFILILLTLLVVYFRAKKAAQVNLVKYLKYE